MKGGGVWENFFLFFFGRGNLRKFLALVGSIIPLYRGRRGEESEVSLVSCRRYLATCMRPRTYVLARAPETRYYWITFLIRRPLYRRRPPALSSPSPPTPVSDVVRTTPRRILHFRIPNGITMQEISFVIYARYKRVHFRLG